MICVGIAGLGRAGWGIHVAALETLPELYRVAGVYDPIDSRMREAVERTGCRAYADYAAMLADPGIDLVVVATPSYLHVDMAIQSLHAGKHALVEKPFAANLAGVDRMTEAARDTGRTLMCSQNYRYAPEFLKVREVMQSGKLGQILMFRMAWHRFARRWDWQTQRDLGGGSLNNEGTHAVDLALLLMDKEGHVDIACQVMSTPLTSGDAEDHVKLTLYIAGAPIADLEFTYACAYPQDPWLVMGTRGGLTGTHSELRWKYLDTDALPPRPADREPTPDRSYNREELPWIEETYPLPREAWTERNARLYRDLNSYLADGAPLPITLESVRRQMEVLERCRQMLEAHG